MADFVHTVPTHVEQAADFLRENLIGEVFPKRYQSIVGSFVLESTLRTGSALEDLSYTLLRRRFKGAKVMLEPNGFETFPDLQVSFGGKAGFYFEVKSKSSETRKYEVDLASVKQFYSYTADRDTRYWQSYYLLWLFEDGPSHVTVKDLEVGQLWQLAGRTEAGLVKLSTGGAGRTKYIQRGGSTFETPAKFRKALLSTYRAMDYSVDEVAKLADGSAHIIRELWPGLALR